MMLILEIALGIVFGAILLGFLPIILPILAIGGFLYVGFWAVIFLIAILSTETAKSFLFLLIIVGVIGAIASSIGNQKKIKEDVKKKEKPENNTHEHELGDSSSSSGYPYHFHEDAEEPPDEETLELMENHDLDQEEAEHVRELMDEEGLDEDDAVELKDEL